MVCIHVHSNTCTADCQFCPRVLRLDVWRVLEKLHSIVVVTAAFDVDVPVFSEFQVFLLLFSSTRLFSEHCSLQWPHCTCAVGM